MSDQDLARILDEMEQLLSQDPFPEDPGVIEAWRQKFAQAVETADRGPEWDDLKRRAQNLGRQVETILQELSRKRNSLKLELDHHAQGSRALKAYRPPGN